MVTDSAMGQWQRRGPRSLLVVAGVLAAAAHAALLAAAQVDPASPTPAAPGSGAENGVAATPAAPLAAKLKRPLAPINPSGYTSARVCGNCHVDIYDSWKNSLHAFSLSDPVFDTAYMQALKAGGDQAKHLCLRCHAPLTAFTGDFDLREGITREGVSCDFCHTITAVHLDKPEKPYSTEPGLVKRSVLRQVASPVHQVVYSPLHETAELCGGCHNLVSPSGAAIMSTYDEWRAGPYPGEGKPCQHCHMVLRSGKVVSRDVKDTPTEEIHLHNLIHDTDQLRSAMTVEVVGTARTTGDISVDVEVENVGSGHKVPTGVPSRELVLTVSLQAGSKQSSQERHYRKVVADDQGNVITHDFEAMLRGAQIVSDNRIAPRERRREHFSFAPFGSGTLKVVATVSYVYSPIILDQREINIELTRAERYLP